MRVSICTLLSLTSGCLTYEVFAERVVDQACSATAACSPSGSGGTCQLFQVPGADRCSFDPNAASRCLNDEWVCNDDQPGFEFAVPPAACDRVCLPSRTE